MRYDLRVLWVEDTSTYFEATKEILEMFSEDIGISLKFDYICNTADFFYKIENDVQGFKLYDLFFIDYSLSDNTVGSDLIRNLRDKKMDSDILFYSSENEDDIRTEVKKNLGSYEGVYIANRKNFEEKSNYLINKNARKLTTLSNIRGFLMDQTSENDYTIKSYILRNFSKLDECQKKQIADLLLDYIKKKLDTFETNAKSTINSLEQNGITNINTTMKSMDELFPIKLKYQVFEKMIAFLSENAFDDVTVKQYIEDIISARNKLAHKKLDVCKTQKYIKYYDTINQFESRKCGEDCSNHSDENKYSLKQWDELRKMVQKFGKSIDVIQRNL